MLCNLAGNKGPCVPQNPLKNCQYVNYARNNGIYLVSCMVWIIIQLENNVCNKIYVVKVRTVCVRNDTQYWIIKYSPLPVNMLKRVYVVVTEPCVSLHSLYRNDIHDEGCTALAAALKECRQLQILRWVWSHCYFTKDLFDVSYERNI